MPDTELQLWSIVGLPLFIFVARVADVALGTVRIALVSRGVPRVAPLVGFFEILIWLFAIGQVVQHLDRPLHYFAYAGGFAAGTWVGMLLDRKLALGMLTVRIITESDASHLIEALREQQFGLTTLAARGLKGRVRLIFAVIRRKDLQRLSQIVERFHPRAFISVSDVRIARRGFFPPASPQRLDSLALAEKK